MGLVTTEFHYDGGSGRTEGLNSSVFFSLGGISLPCLTCVSIVVIISALRSWGGWIWLRVCVHFRNKNGRIRRSIVNLRCESDVLRMG